jgi:hypothetical protein
MVTNDKAHQGQPPSATSKEPQSLPSITKWLIAFVAAAGAFLLSLWLARKTASNSDTTLMVLLAYIGLSFLLLLAGLRCRPSLRRTLQRGLTGGVILFLLFVHGHDYLRPTVVYGHGPTDGCVPISKGQLLLTGPASMVGYVEIYQREDDYLLHLIINSQIESNPQQKIQAHYQMLRYGVRNSDKKAALEIADLEAPLGSMTYTIPSTIDAERIQSISIYSPLFDRVSGYAVLRPSWRGFLCDPTRD